MSNSWPQVLFESLYSEPSKNGVYKTKEFHGSGAKIVNMGELFGYEFIGSQEMKRVQMTEAELTKSGLQNGDLLFGRRSLVEEGAGKCSIVKNLNESTTFESSIIRVRLDRKKTLPEFYYYWFKSYVGRAGVKAIVTGTNVKGIKSSSLKTVSVANPDLKTQISVVEVISKYDDLIENNKRRIALLEESARQLYKEWFVRFRFPGHEHVKIVDGVPEGWKVGCLGDVLELLGGFAFKSSSYTDKGNYGVVTIKNVHDSRFVPECQSRVEEIPDKMKEHCKLNTGDILLSLTGNVGRACIVYGNNYLLNQRVAKIKAKDSISKEFAYWTITEVSMQRKVENLAYGVAQLNLSPLKMAAMEFTIPSLKLISEFSDITKPIFQQIITLNLSNQELARARDLLLPKLMSGELAV